MGTINQIKATEHKLALLKQDLEYYKRINSMIDVDQLEMKIASIEADIYRWKNQILGIRPIDDPVEEAEIKAKVEEELNSKWKDDVHVRCDG